MHVGHHAAHQRLGTERSCHDASPQRRQVVPIEVGTLQLRDEHGRNAVQGRAALGVDQLEDAPRIERLDDANGRAVGESSKNAYDAPEAME